MFMYTTANLWYVVEQNQEDLRCIDLWCHHTIEYELMEYGGHNCTACSWTLISEGRLVVLPNHQAEVCSVFGP